MKNPIPANQAAEMYAAMDKKSMTVAVILAFLFGPFGVMYVSVVAGFILLIAGVVLVAAIPPAAVLVVGACVFTAVVGVNSHNRKVIARANIIVSR